MTLGGFGWPGDDADDSAEGAPSYEERVAQVGEAQARAELADAYTTNAALGERIRRRWRSAKSAGLREARRSVGIAYEAPNRAGRRRAAKAAADHVARLLRWQWDIKSDPTRFRVAVAGRRSGKTYLMCLELFEAACVAEPGSECWYVAKNRRMAKDVAWGVLKAIIPPNWIRGKPNESELSIQLVNYVTMKLRGAEIGDALRGPGLAFLAADEFAFWRNGMDIWNRVLRPMLSHTRGRALIGTSPAGFNHAWEFFERGRAGSDTFKPGWKSWQVAAAEAGLIHPDELAEAQAELDPASYAQEYDARFANLTGLVYRYFSRLEHHERLILLHDRDLILGVDFNVNPMTAVAMQRVLNLATGIEECHVLKAWTLPDSDTPKLIAAVKAWLASKNFTRGVVCCPDASGKARKTSSPSTDHDLLRAAGWAVVVPNANPLVRDRVNAVNTLTRRSDGRTALRIDTTEAKDLAVAFEGLAWVNNEPDPKSPHIHVTDAFGYAVWTQFNTLARRRVTQGRYRLGGA